MLSLTVNYNTTALCPILAVMLSAVLSYLIGRKSERARDIFASLVALAVQCAVCFHNLGDVVCDNGIFDTVFQDIR